MSKKIILTGSTGQDASYMIDYLLANTDNTIICAVRRTSQGIYSNIEHVMGNPRVKLATVDLCDPEAVRSLIRDEKPDYFINFGAQSFVADSWKNPVAHMQTNAVSLIYILEAVREYVPKCRVYSAGSSEQWGDVKYSPQDENHPNSPRSIYGVSKVAAQGICKVYRESYKMYVVHGILLNHESERRQEYFVTRKITLGVARIAYAIKNKIPYDPIQLGNVNAKRDWSHAADFVEGIWLMMNQAEPKEYVLSSNETHTIREFIELAFKAAGIEGHWWNSKKPEDEVYVHHIMEPYFYAGALVTINPAFYRPAEVETLHGSSDLARKELGWKPKISFQELVTRMVKSDIAKYETTNKERKS